MPTGFTAKLYEGKAQTFEEFVLSCAHAFGALVLLRDEGMDAPIPEFEPQTTYYDRQILQGRAKVEKATAWSNEEATAAARADYERRQEHWREYEAKKDPIRLRLTAMRAQVERWTPPTTEHDGLKKFMLEQIDSTLQADCTPRTFEDSYEGGPCLSAEAYRFEVVSRAERDVAYGEQHRSEEIERTASRNAWVTALRESLERVRV